MKINFNDKKLLISIPFLVLLIVIPVFLMGGKNDREKTTKGNNTFVAFLPDSENENIPGSKQEAYKREELNRLQKQREARESEVKGSDFFFAMADDNFEERYRETPSQATVFFPEQEKESEKVVASPKKTTSAVQKKKNEEEIEQEKLRLEYLMSKKNAGKIEDETEAIVYYADGSRKRKTASTGNANIGNRLIQAAIHGDQEVSRGSTVKMRLIEEITINGVVIPANTIFYGTAEIGNDRVKIRVENIKHNNSIAPVKYSIYDNDAIEGLNLPDNIKNELSRRGQQGIIDGVQAPATDNTVARSVISSAVNATKNVARRGTYQVKVFLKSNYRIYIKQSQS